MPLPRAGLRGLLSGRLRGLGRPLLLAIGWLGALSPLALVAVVAVIVWESVRDPQRTFIVSARTTGATIVFDGLANAWPLGPAVLCERLPNNELDPDRLTPPDEPCDQTAYKNVTGDHADARTNHVQIDWPDGGDPGTPDLRQARLLTNESGDLEITLDGATDLKSGTRAILTRENWRSVGALAFIGSATIGNAIGSGERRLLLDGRYEAREPTGLRLSGPVTQTILEGTLTRGEEVRIVQGPDAAPAPGYGHLAAAEPDQDGFHIVMISEPGSTELRLSTIGGDGTGTAEATRISPSWVDRTLKGPLLLALAFILTLGIGVSQLSFEAISLLRTLYSDGDRHARQR